MGKEFIDGLGMGIKTRKEWETKEKELRKRSREKKETTTYYCFNIAREETKKREGLKSDDTFDTSILKS